MCRLTAYLGSAPLPLSDVLLTTPRSLIEQTVRGADYLPMLKDSERISGRNNCQWHALLVD